LYDDVKRKEVAISLPPETHHDGRAEKPRPG